MVRIGMSVEKPRGSIWAGQGGDALSLAPVAPRGRVACRRYLRPPGEAVSKPLVLEKALQPGLCFRHVRRILQLLLADPDGRQAREETSDGVHDGRAGWPRLVV